KEGLMYLNPRPMKRLLFLALAAAAPSANAIVLYDNSTVSSGGENFVNQIFADFPTYSTGIAHDVMLGSGAAYTITDISIYVDRSNPYWLGQLHLAQVHVFSDPLTDSEDPTLGWNNSAVDVAAVTNHSFDAFKIHVGLLNIPVSPGRHWISLVPVIPF